MAVRVWGAGDDRLVEVTVGPAGDGAFRIEGLPEDRVRQTEDRVRAALLNSGVLEEIPAVVLRVHPAIEQGPTAELDLPLALGALVGAGVVGPGLRWIYARGRLLLDGSVDTPGAGEPVALGRVVDEICQRGLIQSERMFERYG